jgi:hypothetical protein
MDEDTLPTTFTLVIQHQVISEALEFTYLPTKRDVAAFARTPAPASFRAYTCLFVGICCI